MKRKEKQIDVDEAMLHGYELQSNRTLESWLHDPFWISHACYVNLYAKNRSLHKDIFKLKKYLIGTPCSMHKLSHACDY